jgi:peptidoglycan/LPS O-acetylase OafA/YrhL
MIDLSGPGGERTGFRPDLEGLRGIAVALVLLYHAEMPGFTGGFVGVDVFFVLSGFLITGLLVRELQASGTVSLPGFYARRIRRILPASALVLVVTLIASVAILAPLQVVDVAGDAAGAALYVVNIRFAVQATDYLQGSLAPSPILHFWSLSAEEQFYFIWPALLLLAARLGGGTSARRLAWPIGAVVLGSFALSLYLTGTNQPWAFFSLPTRAWELGVGAALALAVPRLGALPSMLATGIGLVGLAMVAAAGVLISTETPFPGVWALLPVLGTAAVVAAGVRRPAAPATRALGWSPLRYMGRISYSLYLWHWPILVLVPIALGGPLPLEGRLALVALAFPISAATQRLVEEPLRRGRLIGSLPRRNIVFAAGLSVVVATTALAVGTVTEMRLGGGTALAAADVVADPLGDLSANVDPLAGLVPDDVSSDVAGVANTDGAPSPDGSPEPALSPSPGVSSAPGASPSPGASSGPGASSSPPASPSPSTAVSPAGSPAPMPSAAPSPTLPPTADGALPAGLVPSLWAARSDKPRTYLDGCHLDQPVTAVGGCVYGAVTSRTTVVLFGDSHAAQWFPALERIAREKGWRLVSLTKSACTAADVQVWSSTYRRAYTECDTWRSSAFARIAAERPALVVVASSRSFQPMVAGRATEGEGARAATSTGLARTIRRLEKSAGAVTIIGDTPLAPLDPPNCLSANTGHVLRCATPVEQATDPAWTAMERSVATAWGATFVDPTRWVCPSSPCPAVIGRYLVYRDTHHLATPFVTALSTRLARALPTPRR